MSSNPTFCPRCGQPIQDDRELADDVRLAHHMLSCSTWNISASTASPMDENREYDHRGVLMPRCTRMGGIITPQ